MGFLKERKSDLKALMIVDSLRENFHTNLDFDFKFLYMDRKCFGILEHEYQLI